MVQPDLKALAWPMSQLGEAMAALGRKAGLVTFASDTVNPNPSSTTGDINAWIEWQAKLLGCDAEQGDTTLGDLEVELAAAHPAILRLSPSHYVAVLSARHGVFRVLAPNLEIRRLSMARVCDAIREPVARSQRSEIERLLSDTQVPPARRSKVITLLTKEHLADSHFNEYWRLRVPPGAHPFRWFHEANAFTNLGGLLGAQTLYYLVWLGSWAIIGTLSFNGRMDRGWLWAWALLLISVVPFHALRTRFQGLLAIEVASILKRRLLSGALRLAPEEVRHQGIGNFLGQVFEAEALETLALNGGVTGLLAIIELALSGFVLGPLAILLLVWCGLAALLAWRFLRQYQLWTTARMHMTDDLVETMVGHRTRVAQLPREKWHESEDRMLAHYIERSHSMDRSAAWLMAAIPRGWLLAGLACLAPGIVAARTSPAQIAVALGGLLLAFGAFKRLTGSFVDIASVCVAWKRLSPLFHAAARPERLGEVFPTEETSEPSRKLVEADRLTFRYRNAGTAALQGCSLVIHRGERVLLEGPSGGGKTTFASLLSGLREAESGLLLVNGLDRHATGDKFWRRQVAAAPQFHENNILTETLAFNLLMGRAWPPIERDMNEAEQVCRELGLGDLLDRMPSGLMQMVGEGGWQLSHGERSRIYIARALLQNAELVILDESFAALDPENLHTALQCTIERAPTLLVIAHP